MHWHLLAVKVAEKKIEWYNSMPTARSAKPYAVDVLKKEEMVSRGFLDATEFELVTVEDHPQRKKNGYDRGIFMVKKNVSMVLLMVLCVNYGEVDVPSSNSALQLLLQAHGVPHDHGYELSHDS
ncbi:hypothetical protein H6P81_019998 [Aristolochia fimbriata]|uniref:Ubiquitin-like protease family profile domain-containing protein n=1 Tax=Aristolochia fimbriata TaxID=158543 RepID=A0AAV7DXW4_ARIFI|nr:hypothetical protein H6P81_019998 [Aristolochia fimbriata]